MPISYFKVKKLGTIESVITYGLKLEVLFLNEAKAELIIFISPGNRLPSDPEIKIKNYKQMLDQFVKHLGVFIDEVLSWNKQIDMICSKLSRTNEIIAKLCHFLPQKFCFSFHYSGLTQRKVILTVLANYKNVASKLFLYPIPMAILIVCFLIKIVKVAEIFIIQKISLCLIL